MSNVQIANVVDPYEYPLDEVFSMDPLVNSLQIDYQALSNQINDWVNKSVSKKDGNSFILDQLSTYLIDAFTTLLKTYEPTKLILSRHVNYRKPSSKEAIKIISIIRAKLRDALEKMPAMENSASYTDFYKSFFSEGEGNGARDLFEASAPTSQCNGVLLDNDENAMEVNDDPKLTKCWICRRDLDRSRQSPQCEHILPISDALFHLNLYQHSGSFSKLSGYDQNLLRLEYRWAHRCCNETKNNHKYICHKMEKGKPMAYAVNDEGIQKDIDAIRKASENPDARGCYELFKIPKNPTKDQLNPFGGLKLERIKKYIDPIVETINKHIDFIGKNKEGITQQKRFIVYQYLIMIRFFSRIPGHSMIRAFQENFLSLDPAHIAEQKEYEKKMKEEAEREVREKQEERARQMEATKRKREEEEQRREIRRLTEEQTKLQTQLNYNIETQRKAYSNRRAEAIPKAQQRLAEIQKKLNMINSNESNQPQQKRRREGQRGGGDRSLYADIQSNPEMEMQFILMLAYYPIYLQKHDVEHVDASDYMTRDVWKDEVSHYFKVESKLNINSKPLNTAKASANEHAEMYAPASHINVNGNPIYFNYSKPIPKFHRSVRFSRRLHPAGKSRRLYHAITAGKRSIRRTKKRKNIKHKTRKHRK